MKFKNFRIIALALATVLTICSCQSAEVAPELLEPAVGTTSFRAVSRDSIGDVKVIVGTIVPTDYCHYFKKIIDVDKVYVEIGQYVEKGDVLAIADIESVQNQLNQVNSQLTILNYEHETDLKNYEINMTKLEYQKNWTEYKKNLGTASDDEIKSIDKMIEEAKENKMYNDELYEYMKGKYNQSISDLNEMIEDGTLKAKHSGYVTYIKNFKNGNSVGINENVVIVSDYEDTYIETETFTHAYSYKKFEYKYAYVHDKEVPIEEFNYTDSEVSYARSQNMNMLQRFKFLEDTDLVVGDRVILAFKKYDKKDSLIIGKDSSFGDEFGTFVYVQGEDGALEKRYYEAGITTDSEIEVLSGLEEGELVMYEQNSAKPIGDLEEYVAERKNVSSTADVKGIKIAEKQSILYKAPDKGVISKIYVVSLNEVKKGDPLYEIEIDSQKGKLTEISNEIKHLKQNYDVSVENYNTEKKDIIEAIDKNKSKIDELSHYLDIVKEKIAAGNLTDSQLQEAYGLKSTYEYSINSLYSSTDGYNPGIYILEENLKVLENNKELTDKEYNLNSASLQKQYNEQKKLNNGTGYKTIYAEEDGVVSVVKPSEGYRVEAGDEIILTSNYYDDKVWLGTGYSSMPVGYEFKITGEDATYNALCVSPNVKASYVFTEKGQVYSSYCDVGKNKYFTTEVKEDGLMKNDLSDYVAVIDTYHIDSLVVVPGAYVFKEVDFENKEYYFVWKKENGELIKKFIQRPDKSLGLGNDSYVVVLSGVEVGDILVK